MLNAEAKVIFWKDRLYHVTSLLKIFPKLPISLKVEVEILSVPYNTWDV